jgi:excinuclease UvrABC nuclease subunit
MTNCEFVVQRRKLINDPPPLELHGTVRYRSAWALAVPRLPGVYLMHDLRGVLYVGRADDLRRRYEEHLEASHNPDVRRALQNYLGVLHFSWVLVAAPEQLELERSLIRTLRPLCNVQHNSPRETCA